MPVLIINQARGVQGDSAYVIAGGDAVWGTPAAWLASLQGTPGPAASAPGIYADATAALAGGVPLGGLFEKPDLSPGVVAFPIPMGPKVAVMGDGNVTQGSVGAPWLTGFGAVPQARARSGSKFDLTPNGAGDLYFATAAQRSDQIMTTWLPQVLLSGARACIFQFGTDDAIAGIATSVFVANVVSAATQLRTAGIYPIFLAPPPMPLAATGNATGTYSGRLAAYYAALPSALAAAGCFYIPAPDALSATPGSHNGIGDDSYFTDHLHLSDVGQAPYGRALAPLLTARFSLPGDPYNMAGTDVTTNPQLAGTGGQPTNWFPVSVPVGASLTGQTLVDIGGGNFALELTVAQGTAAGSFAFAYAASQVGGSVAGKTLDAIATLQVMSGNFIYAQIANFNYGSGSSFAYDLLKTNTALSGVALVAADGPLILRTPKVVPAGTIGLVGPRIQFAGTGVIRISQARSRSF